ncbi:MAG: acyl-CoA dehydrogenase family protein [Dehalococcoidia bacterium]|nr:acyl-CoA dehydrogenase family protein [Dehalococcoidia bacterium]
MEFGYTEEQEKLRQGIHDFFKNELPADYGEAPVRAGEEMEQFTQDMQSKAVKHGYPSAGWPKKYGGLGFTSLEQGVVSEEMAYWGFAWPGGMGYNLVGPVILAVGTEEQKERFVPPIARGEVICFEAYTEPNAGSDEANVQLKAVKDGDAYVLNGQKTFISGQRKPDWLFTLVRTAESIPKHRGISLFMVPGNSPGITYRPLPTMSGSRQNEIFFDNVRVPKANLIGEENRGFYAAMATFEFERAAIGLDARRGMRRMADFCRTEKRNGNALIKDPKAREMLARQAMHTQIGWLVGWFGAWRRTQRQKLGPQSYDLSMFLRKDWQPHSANLLMNLFDMYGQLEGNSEHVKFDGNVGRRWEASRIIHPAGTPEILKNVIANRGLGLPRVPRKFNAMINESLESE